MQCPNCHSTVPDTANVCGYCGTRLRQPAPPAVPVQPPPPVPQPVQPVSQPVQPPQPAPPTPVPQQVMPSPTARARMPGWAWGVIGGLVVIVAVFAFLAFSRPGKSNPPAVEQPQAEVPTLPPPQEPTPTTQRPTSVPTSPSGIVVEPINLEDRGDIPTIRSLADERLNIDISMNQDVVVTWGWCTTTQEILEQNWEHITISFAFDEKPIPSSRFRISDFQDDRELYCRSYSGIVRSWPEGQHVFEFLMITDETINDGLSDYPQGEIGRWTFYLNVSR